MGLEYLTGFFDDQDPWRISLHVRSALASLQEHGCGLTLRTDASFAAPVILAQSAGSFRSKAYQQQ
jgi:hypothetical protein